MTHQKIYEKLLVIFPEMKDKTGIFFQNGKDSIRIRHWNKKEYVFTYISDDDWKFETVKHFMNNGGLAK